MLGGMELITISCRKNELRMIRGTTQTLEVRLLSPDGSAYKPLDGDVLRFGIRYDEDSSSYLLKKETSELTGGIGRFMLEPEDTTLMECGCFKYDIGLQSGDLYEMVIPYSDFVLLPNITAKE